jgi:VWFA-related protein
MRCSTLVLAAAALPLLFLPPLRAQSAPSPDAPPVSTAPPPQDDTQSGAPVTTLRVNSNLVSVYFTVRDRHGALIPDLAQSDCQVLEDHKPQKIRNFAAETNQPLTLGMMLDTSGSQMNVLPLEQQSGSTFLHEVLEKKDEAFLISFDVDVDLLEDFTNNAGQLSRAMDKAQINTAAGNGGFGVPGLGQGTIPTQGAPKGTLLYDAVVLASNDKLRAETGRKAMILLTDGGDQGSKYRLQDAISAAQKANSIVYVILIADRGFYSGRGIMLGGDTGEAAMRRMAEATGGRVIDVGNNGQKLDAAFQQIEDELRTQYVISYVPQNTDFNGKYRALDVQCKGDGLKVQAQKGYYATQQDNSDQ